MLYDWRRALSIEHAKTIDARMKATAWFENVIEPLRDKHGITLEEAIQIWEDIRKRAEEFEELSPEEEKLWTIFERTVYP